MSDKKILIITAHSDDDIICAGSVFKLQELGYAAYELLLTNSQEGQDKRISGKQKQLDVIRLRENEFNAASKFLGLKQKFIFGEEDLNLNFSKEIMLRVVQIIREVKPNIIFSMNENDYHKDHIAASKITQEASFWAATGIRPELGEPHRADIVLYGEGMLPIEADILVDITNYQNKKMQLFKIYQSQANPKALQFTESLMRIRGYHLRKRPEEYAEAFTVNKKFPIILF